MEHIKKSIYRMPGMRRALKPLWAAWALVVPGAVCGGLYAGIDGLSEGLSSTLVFFAAMGALCLVLVLCYWLFGDSRRPYSRELHALLDPTTAYYEPASRQALLSALEAGDEKALDAVRRVPGGKLALVRYSDCGERVYYSQLVEDGVPVSDIIVSKPQQH